MRTFPESLLDTSISTLAGKDDRYWEPLWKIEVKLNPAEIELINSPPIRRLNFIHHAGPNYINSHINHSRFQHTLGVFSIVSHLQPDNDILRIAALLHDVGHAAFSHAMEQIEGINHHQLTQKYVFSSPISDILKKYEFNPDDVFDYIEGKIPSILRNKDNILHADHIDNFVRTAYLDGKINIPPPKILQSLKVIGTNIETDIKTAKELLKIIILVNRSICSAENIGVNTIFAQLVLKLVNTKSLSKEEIISMFDSQVESMLLTHPLIREKAQMLWLYPQNVRIQKLKGDEIPKDSLIGEIRKLYLAMPLVKGKQLTEISSMSKLLVDDTKKLIGKYAVSLEDAA